MLGKMLIAVAWPFGPRRDRVGTCVHRQRRIVSMIDEGCSYALVRRTMNVRSSDIDVALRQSER